MSIYIKIVGIFFIACSVLYFARPDILKHLLEFFSKGNRVYLAGLIRFLLAVLFLVSARDCRIPWAMVAFGVLFLIGGVLVFVLGPKRLAPMFDWWLGRPTWLIRILGIVALAFGGIIVYAA